MILNWKNLCSSFDLQLLLYILGIAETLIYGLVGVTYVCALIAFNKASGRLASDDEEGKKATLVLETEALVQIFGIAMFFIVSIVMVNGVVESNRSKILPYLLLCCVQMVAIVVYSLFVYQSIFFIVFATLKILPFTFAFSFYRRLAAVKRESEEAKRGTERRKSVRWVDEVME